MIRIWAFHKIIDIAISLLGDRVINNFKLNQYRFKVGDEYNLIIKTSSEHKYVYHNSTVMQIYPNVLIINSRRRIHVCCDTADDAVLLDVNSMVHLNTSDEHTEFYK